MPMKKTPISEKGFTLIEIIATLAITGVLAAIAGLGIANMATSFSITKANTAALLKGQVALNRTVKELNNIKAVDAVNTGQSQITFTSYRMAGSHTLVQTGANLLLDGDILTDGVSSFTLSYYDAYNGSAATTWTLSRRVIDVSLTMTGAQSTPLTLTARVTPSVMTGI